MSNPRSVEDLPAELERLVAARDELWRRHERAIADARRLADYAGSLGADAKPAALPGIADLNLLSPAARQAVAGIHAEATQIATMHDEIQQRRSRIVDLRQQADRARTMRKVVIAGAVFLVLILLFLLAVSR